MVPRDGGDSKKKAPIRRPGQEELGNDLLSQEPEALSTISAGGLNYRVRDGTGWTPVAKVTK